MKIERESDFGDEGVSEMHIVEDMNKKLRNIQIIEPPL